MKRALAAIALTTTALFIIGAATACGRDDATTNSTPVIDPGDGGRYTPVIDPGEFSVNIDNSYLPLRPGARWQYRETDAQGETEDITVEVLDGHREVMGVQTVVVHDVVTADGEVIEDTYDWYAQDSRGNVWYFGEDTTAFHDGVASTDGSWEAGVDGAMPGIAMLAHPVVTENGYRQEFFAGRAEDMGQVIGVGATVTVGDDTYHDVVVTRDWTPLEPDVIEEKYYAPGVGFVKEVKTAGGAATVTLVHHEPGVR